MCNTNHTTTATRTHEGRWAKNPEGKWMVAITKMDGPYVTEGDTILVVKRDGTTQTKYANGDFDFPTVESGRPNLFGVRDSANSRPKYVPVPKGVHINADGTPVLVKISEMGRPYGKKWNGHRFEYDRSAIAGLSADTLITAEQAAEFGHAHHICVFCCRDLSTPESTAVGYGPVCAKTHNLPWGTKQGALV